ncbi:Protein of unknown function [Pyronema omphalodes CBS 100304]|uniref:Uncharacterized protein n=1 Tax=Pyronema omphalodes (strain CBS 100304) TaxID=1076935 RepID=U4KVM9_PYROM|nr:Protein of unknown function [Pyronema omphalodes CBS 100304]
MLSSVTSVHRSQRRLRLRGRVSGSGWLSPFASLFLVYRIEDFG